MSKTKSVPTAEEADVVGNFVGHSVLFIEHFATGAKRKGKMAVKEIDEMLKRAPDSVAKDLVKLIKPLLKSVSVANKLSLKMLKATKEWQKGKLEYPALKKQIDKAWHELQGVGVYAEAFDKKGGLTRAGVGYGQILTNCKVFTQQLDRDLRKDYKKLPKA